MNTTSRGSKLMARFRAPRKGQKGQSTTEYVLLLLFVVIAVKAVGGQMKDRLDGIMKAAFGKVTTEIESN